MKVFIENEAGSDQKNIYDEKTLVYRKSYTVSRKYPYPYGFILNTTSGDGDNLDCFIITNQAIKTGTIVEGDAIGLMEQTDDGEVDDNVLAVLPHERVEVTLEVKETLTEFISHVFDHKSEKQITAGRFLSKEVAEQRIQESLDT